ncbi:MAG: S1 RNA-binding domain-containing protein [Caldithrix sp.]|nr:S1 RNA-binding domain-containing protein [Caldithrix sp.]
MNEVDMISLIADAFNLKHIQISHTIELLDEGNTVPFIARYRKEKTGSLDENQIRDIEDRIKYLRALEDRKKTILSSIEEQGKLTAELKAKIEKTVRMQELEDLYLPYKPKKRTRATIAKEKGLQPLAEMILKQDITSGHIEEIANDYINGEKEVADTTEALQGARDIVAEVISDDAEIRKIIRKMTFEEGLLETDVKAQPEDRTVYEMYYEFHEPISSLPPHRILAINRGETEGILKVTIDAPVEKMIHATESQYIKNPQSLFTDHLKAAIKDAYNRLIAPSIAREVRNALTEKADEHAISVFATNLKNLLLQPPVSGKIIMGIDPGFRTGCKVAVIDQTGKYLEGDTIYPHPPQNQYFEAKTTIRGLTEKYNVDIIAIGNGTASRETEQMVAELINEIKPEKKLAYIIVNEAGASVYSASKVAQQEFPDLEASMRGNISIARRLLDPLAELVKIDPKSIGVGLYQHDVNQKLLAQSLNQVVESAVNMVGVDINTASPSLLKYVSGLTSRTATAIIQYRDAVGRFSNRQELKKVPGIGAMAFQQSAGFLRITDGDNPLDNTAIHPESYDATEKLLQKFKIQDIHSGGQQLKMQLPQSGGTLNQLLQDLGIGKPTLDDIVENLAKPGRDPREALPGPILKSDVLKMEDLKEGMVLKGTVRNVVDFGAFVDIGVKQDGLVHISKMAKKFVKNPLNIVAVGDVIEVKVTSIDLQRGRIGLSMIVE